MGASDVSKPVVKPEDTESLAAVELVVDKLVYGGEGLGRLPDGRVVFVEGALPGETVTVTLDETVKRKRSGKLVSVLQPSALRLEPRCCHAAVCGGCHWQHLAYEAQLQWKHQIVAESLQRIGQFEAAVVKPPIGFDAEAGGAWRYRQTVRWAVHQAGDGRFALAYHRRHEHEGLVAVSQCPVLPVPLERLIQAINDHGQAVLAMCGEVVARIATAGTQTDTESGTGADTGLCVVGFCAAPDRLEDVLGYTGLSALYDTLKQAVPTLSGLQWVLPDGAVVSDEDNGDGSDDHSDDHSGDDNDKEQPTDFQPVAGTVDVEARFTTTDGIWTFPLGVGHFFQNHAAGAQALLDVVEAQLPPASGPKAESLLDLYAGVGFFTVPFARRFDRVVAVEGQGEALARLVDYAAGQGLINIMALNQSVESFVTLPAEPVTVTLLDPPRNGVLPAVLACGGGQHHMSRIVYVSCNPTTLARDLRQLCEAGWQLAWVQPVDMFAQTYHIECVAMLTRRPDVAADVAEDGDAQGNPPRIGIKGRLEEGFVKGISWAFGDYFWRLHP
ncbi:MAG: TRAM domain-containing protein [Vampirovibrionales bacterium]